MSAERFQQIEELFHAARQHDPRECGTFLAQACRGDEELRREVESLLAQDGSAGPMDRPAIEVAADLLAREPATPVAAGTQFGPYQIESALGAGGMVRVYKARDTRLGRTVAIKNLNRRFSERFEREARAISALNHPHICTLYDVGPNFLVMEVVEGETVAATLRKGALSIDLALSCAAQIAEALAEAHSKGIIHRGMKPANLMLTQSGTVKVIDFGLAKLDYVTGAGETTLTAGLETASGLVLGTALYMSPEQAEGKPVDARSDIFSTGAVLYEMLTGIRAFDSDSTAGVVSKVLRDTPRRIRELRPEVPRAAEVIVTRCLEKDPALRYPSGSELASALIACARPSQRVGFSKRARVLSACVLIAVMSLAGWFYYRNLRVRWTRNEALPKIQAFMMKGDNSAAFDLTRDALHYVPDDPQLKQFWSEISVSPEVATTPAGAKVSYKPYNDAASPWRLMGVAPFRGAFLPNAYLRLRVEKDGWDPVEFAAHSMALSGQNVLLSHVGRIPSGMVSVPAQAPWADTGGVMPLPDYFLDKFEVTNHQFQRFLDAGGYRDHKYWNQPFRREGREISFAQASASFRDSTGRPGPATWELGVFPKDKGDFPVSGVSWFEANAYCAYAGKSLPTVHHWRKAAGFGIFSDILLLSNFAGAGTAPTGANTGISAFGAYDMAGNVKEWCQNEAGQLRAILGGGWNEAIYSYRDRDAQDPFSRAPQYGMRCAVYPAAIPLEALAAIGGSERDYSTEKPVTDDAFQIYRRMYQYDRTALDAKTESVDDSNPYWRREKVSYRAAYGGERIPANLYLPKNAKPPYQTVLWVPGGYAWLLRDSETGVGTEWFNFLMRTGRAVLYPVYQATFERGGRALPWTSGPNVFRDTLIQIAKDVSRSVDFLESRSDVQSGKLAYYGLSTGGTWGPIFLALEPRFKTGILVGGGLFMGKAPSEADVLNFAPRVRIPVLMLNGRYDFAVPSEAVQKPMFRLLGSPERDKQLIQVDSGHLVPLRDLVREVLNWLDRYIGPVDITVNSKL